MAKYKQYIIFGFIIIFAFQNAKAQKSDKEEMRGAWITTVKNIDYPTYKKLTSEQQKKEFIDILEMYKRIGINAVFFQLRPAADTFFPSQFEPWSEWLTGKQGKAPDPYYDPLEFMITETHKRGMEFHAWFNPFRAIANIETADVCPEHITNKKPEWFFTYGINVYFNTGIPEVQDYVIKVITDVVTRYDIDGVHFDDYFYPYPERDDNKKLIPVPDSKTFEKYGRDFSSIADWRRNNLNSFIKNTSIEIKKIKPYIKFGIAPSGIWRNKGTDPKGSATRGFEHYDYLYADVLKWLKDKYIDYVAPQIYWNIGNSHADYKTLIDWWSQNTYGRHLYIGQGIYMADANAAEKAWRNPSELPNQMRINRKTKEVRGNILYKTSALKKNPLGFDDSLRNNFYAINVKTPKMSWLPERQIIIIDTVITDTTLILADRTPTPPPFGLSITKMKNYYILSWEKPKVSGISPNDEAVLYTVYKFKGTEADMLLKDNEFEQTDKTYTLIERKRFSLFKKEFTFVITALDKAKNRSKSSDAIHLRLKE